MDFCLCIKELKKAVSNSRKAAVNYQRQLALRKDHDPVSSMTNEHQFEQLMKGFEIIAKRPIKPQDNPGTLM